MRRIAAFFTLFAVTSFARANIQDTTADAVLGQADLASSIPNASGGTPSATSLATAWASQIAIAPDGRIYVADADNHRVISWPSAAAFQTGDPADRVIGQPDFTSNAPNNGGVSATSFFLPQGMDIDDEGNLWVTDAYNSRVLKFNNPDSDATPLVADLVIGQPDFVSNLQNHGNGKNGPDVALQDSLQFPGRVIARGQDVWIADSGNSRVLHYTNPTTNLPLADRVFGQYGDFTCRAKNNPGDCSGDGCCAKIDNLYNPIGIALAPDGTLYIADWNNHRILRFDDPLTSDTVADGVIGQPDFVSNGFDFGGPATGLQLPIDIMIDGAGWLYVADSGNNRILVYTDPANSPVPDAVFGQLDNLTTDAPNHGLGFFTTDADGLFGPTAIAIDAACNIYAADTNNSRVLRYDAPLRLCADMNCDGQIDLDDIEPFVLLLIDRPVYEAAHPACAAHDGDLNHDGKTDSRDTSYFVNILLP